MLDAMAMHPDQLDVPVTAVRRLVARQFPQWAGLPVTPVRSAGTVNAVFRVGDRLTARFPLVPGPPDEVHATLVREQEAARELVGRTRFATPEPVAIGEPGEGYPLPWAVQTWLDGTSADVEDASGSDAFGVDLAELVAAVRAIDTRGRTFSGRGRGGDIASHDEWVALSLDRSEGLLDVPPLRALWRELRDLPREAPDVMAHGDLVPGNLLVDGGRLTGVLDTGGLGPADPALDVGGAWHLLEAGPRRQFHAAVAPDDLTWARGRAWAFVGAIGGAWYYWTSNPVMSAAARRTLERLLAGE